MAFERPPKREGNAEPFKAPTKKGYDIRSINSWDEALQLFEEGKITKHEWEDFVDMACGY